MCILIEAQGNLNLNGVFTVWNLPKIVGAEEHTACDTPPSQSVLGAVPRRCCVCVQFTCFFPEWISLPDTGRLGAHSVGSLRVGGKLSWRIRAVRLTDA